MWTWSGHAIYLDGFREPQLSWSNVTPPFLDGSTSLAPEANGDLRPVHFDMRVPVLWIVGQVLDCDAYLEGGMGG